VLVTTENGLRGDVSNLSSALASAQLSHDKAMASVAADATAATAAATEEAYSKGVACGRSEVQAAASKAAAEAQVRALRFLVAASFLPCHGYCVSITYANRTPATSHDTCNDASNCAHEWIFSEKRWHLT
jgi:hypothetical protein